MKNVKLFLLIVEQLPADARFKDIKVILHEYETWKKNNSIKMLQT